MIARPDRPDFVIGQQMLQPVPCEAPEIPWLFVNTEHEGRTKHEAAPVLEHSPHFAERCLRVFDVLEHLHHVDCVERAIVKAHVDGLDRRVPGDHGINRTAITNAQNLAALRQCFQVFGELFIEVLAREPFGQAREGKEYGAQDGFHETFMKMSFGRVGGGAQTS